MGIDMDFHKTMMALYRQSNPQEIILGWYSTGTAITDHSILIHDFFGREIQRPPVHVCVGCDLSQGQGVSLNAYMSQSVALKDRLFGSHFAPVPLRVAAEGSARAVLAAAVQETTEPSGLVLQLSSLAAQLSSLLALVAQRSNPAAGRALLAALRSAGGGGATLLRQTALDAALQDTLALVYLAKLTRAQVHMSAQLHSLFAPAPAAKDTAVSTAKTQ